MNTAPSMGHHTTLRVLERTPSVVRRTSAAGPVTLTCSPKTDPFTMRVQLSQQSRKRRTLSEENPTHSRADSAQAARSRGEAGHWSFPPAGRQRPRDKRGHLPPLEKPLRSDESKRDQAPQGPRKGELSPQEAGGRAGTGH